MGRTRAGSSTASAMRAGTAGRAHFSCRRCEVDKLLKGPRAHDGQRKYFCARAHTGRAPAVKWCTREEPWPRDEGGPARTVVERAQSLTFIWPTALSEGRLGWPIARVRLNQTRQPP